MIRLVYAEKKSVSRGDGFVLPMGSRKASLRKGHMNRSLMKDEAESKPHAVLGDEPRGHRFGIQWAERWGREDLYGLGAMNGTLACGFGMLPKA